MTVLDVVWAVLGIALGVLLVYVGVQIGSRRTWRNGGTVVVNAPAETVFACLTEPDQLKQWIGGLEASEPLTAEGLCVGARSREVVVERGRRYELESEVTALEEPFALTVVLRHAGFTSTAAYRLTPHDGETVVELVQHTAYHHWWARVFAPMVTRAAQRKIEGDLRRLATVAEAGA